MLNEDDFLCEILIALIAMKAFVVLMRVDVSNVGAVAFNLRFADEACVEEITLGVLRMKVLGEFQV